MCRRTDGEKRVLKTEKPDAKRACQKRRIGVQQTSRRWRQKGPIPHRSSDPKQKQNGCRNCWQLAPGAQPPESPPPRALTRAVWTLLRLLQRIADPPASTHWARNFCVLSMNSQLVSRIKSFRGPREANR